MKKVEDLYTKKYEYPKNMTNKLYAISERGQKNDWVSQSDIKKFDAMHWTKQDFLYNYYASYIFSSLDSKIWTGEKEKGGKKLRVKMDFFLVKTSLLEIAFKRLQEIEGN